MRAGSWELLTMCFREFMINLRSILRIAGEVRAVGGWVVLSRERRGIVDALAESGTAVGSKGIKANQSKSKLIKVGKGGSRFVKRWLGGGRIGWRGEAFLPPKGGTTNVSTDGVSGVFKADQGESRLIKVGREGLRGLGMAGFSRVIRVNPGESDLCGLMRWRRYVAGRVQPRGGGMVQLVHP